MNISTNTNLISQESLSFTHNNRLHNMSKSSATEETKEINALEEYKEGDYSTYSVKELKALSYEELKENYDEIKDIVAQRLDALKDTSEYEDYTQYKNVTSNKSLIHTYEYVSATNELVTKVELTKLSEGEREIDDLHNLEKQLKAVDYFKDEEINKAIFSMYQNKHAETLFDIITPPGLKATNFGSTHSSGNTASHMDMFDLISLEIEDRKKLLREGVDEQMGDITQMQIGTNAFNIYEIKVSKYEQTPKIDEDKNENKIQNDKAPVSSIKEEKIDYTTYTSQQLRELPFEEVKDNYESLESILSNALVSMTELLQDDADNLIAFKMQLEQSNYLKNDELNEVLYDKIKDIKDPKVAIWSALAIKDNIENLMNNTIDSLIIDNIRLDKSDIERKGDDKDNQSENKSFIKENKGTTQINLDDIIRTVSKAASQGAKNEYNKELIAEFTNFISQYNELKDSLFK